MADALFAVMRMVPVRTILVAVLAARSVRVNGQLAGRERDRDGQADDEGDLKHPELVMVCPQAPVKLQRSNLYFSCHNGFTDAYNPRENSQFKFSRGTYLLGAWGLRCASSLGPSSA